ncbi:hypothetical protein [Streptomyces sp. ME19-01-6]|nr:hypothetical protein [Streptomyces sp. ME19-01-6]MDX3233521.1 hypothetical protein [Streptomyces sp. ME19-01-6]
MKSMVVAGSSSVASGIEGLREGGGKVTWLGLWVEHCERLADSV